MLDRRVNLIELTLEKVSQERRSHVEQMIFIEGRRDKLYFYRICYAVCQTSATSIFVKSLENEHTDDLVSSVF